MIIVKNDKFEVPNYFDCGLMEVTILYYYGTRGNKATLRVPRVRTEAAKKSFWFQGPSCFNELPIDIRSLDSIVVFKHRLKENLQGL